MIQRPRQIYILLMNYVKLIITTARHALGSTSYVPSKSIGGIITMILQDKSGNYKYTVMSGAIIPYLGIPSASRDADYRKLHWVSGILPCGIREGGGMNDFHRMAYHSFAPRPTQILTQPSAPARHAPSHGISACIGHNTPWTITCANAGLSSGNSKGRFSLRNAPSTRGRPRFSST